ncbi:CASP-like protein [Forsythia ovata]|uniref:CASP-like protein n=1 Tax=Forsythia ovata TaxID=205694 RepID=A0ABD1TQQ4_9LAMI
MENNGSISLHKTQKISFVSQILLRVLAIAGTLAATWIILTSKETVVVFGIQVDARYSYSSAFKLQGSGSKKLFLHISARLDFDNVVDGGMLGRNRNRVLGEIWQQPHWLDANL